MAALLTLAEAKRHLNLKTVDRDADVWDKVQAASEMILDHLKGVTLVVATLTSSGGIATVTTTAAHGLTTGGTVFIRGASNEEYNGEAVVTVTGATTFTYAVTGTPAATATGVIRVRRPYDYTHETAPWNVKAAVQIMLTHLWEHRGDDMKDNDAAVWEAVKNILVYRRVPTLA